MSGKKEKNDETYTDSCATDRFCDYFLLDIS